MPEVYCYCFEIAENIKDMEKSCITRTLKALNLENKSWL